MKRMLTREEHNALFAFLESKCLTLWDVENNENGIYRDFAQTAFPINLTSIQNVSASDEIIIFQNSSFIRYKEECEKAYRNDSSVFVDGNAVLILKAMFEYSQEKSFGLSFDDYCYNVCSESCSYALHRNNGVLDDRILRVDTFRKKKGEDEDGIGFRGGLFHALYHFTLDDEKKNHRNYLFDLDYLQYLSAFAFFMGEDGKSNKRDTIVKLIKNPIHPSKIKFAFFIEGKSNIGFIDSIYPLWK